MSIEQAAKYRVYIRLAKCKNRLAKCKNRLTKCKTASLNVKPPRQMLKKRQSHNIQRDTSKKACKCATSSLLSRPRPIQKRKKKRKNTGNMTGGGPPCNLIPWHRQSHSRPAASFHTLSKSSCPQHHPNGLLPLAIYFYFSRYACP